MFWGVWAVAKGFMSERSRDKMEVLGSNFAPTLLEYVDAENLPTFLGGTCTCADLTGDCMTSGRGPWNEYESVRPKGVKRKQLLQKEHKCLLKNSNSSENISEGVCDT